MPVPLWWGVGLTDKTVASICHGSLPKNGLAPRLQGQGLCSERAHVGGGCWAGTPPTSHCPRTPNLAPVTRHFQLPSGPPPSSPAFLPSHRLFFAFYWLFVLEFCLHESSGGLGRCCFEIGSSYADEEINILKEPEVKACTERCIQCQQ